MKKYSMKFFWIYLFLIFFSFISHARNAKEAFLSMPSQMFPDISIENRVDLIESYDEKIKTSVANKFKEDILIESLTEEYLSLNMGNSTLQIIVLPMVNESQLYCLIHTVCGTICDSNIKFYSLSWNPLNTDTFISITPQNWFIEDIDKFPELAISLMQFDYDNKKKTLIQTNNSTQYLSVEDQQKIKTKIKKSSREYKWDGIKFESKQ